MQPLQEMPAPFGQIDGARRQSFGMETQAQHIEGLAEQALGDALEQRRHHTVGRYQIPMAVDREGWIGLVRFEHKIDRSLYRFQRGVVERTLRKRRREPCRDQQHVALAQRHIQPLREL